MVQADQQYIRRFTKGAVSKDRTVKPRAFAPRKGESILSFTLRNRSLESSGQLREYQQCFLLQSGDLPGLCFLTHHNLTDDLKPPLPPRYEEDKEDRIFGKLHHATDAPTETQRNQMATQATQNGLLLPGRFSGREHPPDPPEQSLAGAQ